LEDITIARLRAVIDICKELAAENREKAEHQSDNYMCGNNNGRAAAYETVSKWIENALDGKSLVTADNSEGRDEKDASSSNELQRQQP